MGHTRFKDGNPVYSVFNSNVNLIQKNPPRHNQNNVWPKVWASHSPVKLTHKIHHHTNSNHPPTTAPFTKSLSTQKFSFVGQVLVSGSSQSHTRLSKWISETLLLLSLRSLCSLHDRPMNPPRDEAKNMTIWKAS